MSALQEQLSNEQANSSNKLRQWNQMNHMIDWAINKQLMNSGINGLGSGGFMNGFGYNNPLAMQYGMYGTSGYDSFLSGAYGMGGFGYGNPYSMMMGGYNPMAMLSGFGGNFNTNLLGDLRNDMYQAFASRNDYQDLFDDNALSEMMCDDIEQQITAIKSQIQADTAELKSLEEGEKEAINRSACKYA